MNDSLLSKLDFQLQQCGNFIIECFNFDIAVELWGRREELEAYLRHFPQVKLVTIQVCGKTEYPVLKIKKRVPTMQPFQEIIDTITPVAIGLKASIFVIHYDGTYLEYLDAGHPGKTVVPYDQMIGNKAMELLPEPMRSIVIANHDQAVATGKPQSYLYNSPTRGIPFRSIAIPYPEKQFVALLVFPEQTLVPA
ncbi:hypothetical protein AB3R30_18735 [Leptolyngbyaceae cyanobacterium UHCC 1019]